MGFVEDSIVHAGVEPDEAESTLGLRSPPGHKQDRRDLPLLHPQI